MHTDKAITTNIKQEIKYRLAQYETFRLRMYVIDIHIISD